MADVPNSPHGREIRVKEDTLLYRIINSRWFSQQGAVSSQAFRPRNRDNKRLSAYDGDRIRPEDAFHHYPKRPSLPLPVGVLAVTAAECRTLELSVVPDPDAFPEHVLIDFSAWGTSQIHKKAKRLRNAAVKRGWLFQSVP